MKAKRLSRVFVSDDTKIEMFRHGRHTLRWMRSHALGSIVLGPPRKTGDNWYFSPRPAESLDAAEVTIVSGPVDAQHEGKAAQGTNASPGGA